MAPQRVIEDGCIFERLMNNCWINQLVFCEVIILSVMLCLTEMFNGEMKCFIYKGYWIDCIITIKKTW